MNQRRIGFETLRRALALSTAMLAGMAQAAEPPPTTPGAKATFAEIIEAAHHADIWRTKAALQAGLTVEFGGKRALEGTILFDNSAGRSRIELADGTVAVFDGNMAWVSPASSPLQGARFHVLTWPYFIAVPMKLSDPGARLVEQAPMKLGGTEYPTAKLTFAPGTGDAPDDWYILYRDPATNRLRAMAYIVTFGKTAEEANKEPHGIVYERYTEVEGVPVVAEASFWNWSEAQGMQGDIIGRLVLTDAKFVTPKPDAFTAPEAAREEHAPR